jgi:hypothetical protein
VLFPWVDRLSFHRSVIMLCGAFFDIANGSCRQINPVHQSIVEIVRETRFDDLEIRRDVEVTRGAERGISDLHDVALHDVAFEPRDLWQNGITDHIKCLRDQRRTDNLGWPSYTQCTLRSAPKLLEGDGDQVANEAKKIAKVITKADPFDGVFADALALLLCQPGRAADPGVTPVIFRKRRGKRHP